MGETILGTLSKNGCCASAAHFIARQNFAHLTSRHADNLKYGYTDALGYNNRFGSNLEVALMKKSINGEKTA